MFSSVTICSFEISISYYKDMYSQLDVTTEIVQFLLKTAEIFSI